MFGYGYSYGGGCGGNYDCDEYLIEDQLVVVYSFYIKINMEVV